MPAAKRRPARTISGTRSPMWAIHHSEIAGHVFQPGRSRVKLTAPHASPVKKRCRMHEDVASRRAGHVALGGDVLLARGLGGRALADLPLRFRRPAANSFPLGPERYCEKDAPGACPV